MHKLEKEGFELMYFNEFSINEKSLSLKRLAKIKVSRVHKLKRPELDF